jgi:predicted site-specific integrase-resolvase
MEQLKTRQQVADEIGVSRKTLYRWIKKKKLHLAKGLLCPQTQKLIKEKIFGQVSQDGP